MGIGVTISMRSIRYTPFLGLTLEQRSLEPQPSEDSDWQTPNFWVVVIPRASSVVEHPKCL